MAFHRLSFSTSSLIILPFTICLWASIALSKKPIEDVPKGISLVSTGPSIPYTHVENSILVKRGAVVATNLKRFGHGFGEKAQIGLLSSTRFAELNVLLRTLGAYELASSSPQVRAEARVVHTITVRDDYGFHRPTLATQTLSPRRSGGQ